MFILRIEYRFNGEKKMPVHVEYKEFNELEEAIEMRDRWIRLFKYDCSLFNVSIYEMTNY